MTFSVIPAKAGIHTDSGTVTAAAWIPAFGFPSKYSLMGSLRG
jgi:hypothetical protein